MNGPNQKPNNRYISGKKFYNLKLNTSVEIERIMTCIKHLHLQ